MGFNIPRINSALNMYQCTVHWCHWVPKCDGWFFSHVLGQCFQEWKAVFCCSQMCRVELHVLIILD